MRSVAQTWRQDDLAEPISPNHIAYEQEAPTLAPAQEPLMQSHKQGGESIRQSRAASPSSVGVAVNGGWSDSGRSQSVAKSIRSGMRRQLGRNPVHDLPIGGIGPSRQPYRPGRSERLALAKKLKDSKGSKPTVSFRKDSISIDVVAKQRRLSIPKNGIGSDANQPTSPSRFAQSPNGPAMLPAGSFRTPKLSLGVGNGAGNE